MQARIRSLEADLHLLNSLGKLDRPNQPNRQKDDGAHQFQNSADCNAHDPEGKQQQPYDRICDKGQQRQRPAQNQENAPQQKLDHNSASTSFKEEYGERPWPVPGYFFLMVRFEASGLFLLAFTALDRGSLARAASSFFRSRMSFFRSLRGISSTALVRRGSFSKIRACARCNSSSISRGRKTL